MLYNCHAERSVSGVWHLNRRISPCLSFNIMEVMPSSFSMIKTPRLAVILRRNFAKIWRENLEQSDGQQGSEWYLINCHYKPILFLTIEKSWPYLLFFKLNNLWQKLNFNISIIAFILNICFCISIRVFNQFYIKKFILILRCNHHTYNIINIVIIQCRF